MSEPVTEPLSPGVRGGRRAGGGGRGARRYREGDLVVACERVGCLKPVVVKAGGQLQNRYGTFKHRDWVGRHFGSRVDGVGGKGFLYLLAPTAELWTQSLPHRTQILYAPDIAMVVTFLELRPGGVVLESGTGSGSLTHALARAVGPRGHVWTYEFHEQRAELARQEFESHGLGSFVSVNVRNIVEDGFPAEKHEGSADAAFLDLPRPADVVESAAKCLKPNGMLCTFSPCIEQVQSTCREMVRHGFMDLRPMEVMARTYDVRKENFDGPGLMGLPGQGPFFPPKRQKTAGGEAVPAGGPTEEARPGASTDEAEEAGGAAGAVLGSDRVFAKPNMEARGHTGYLTFARLAPVSSGD